MTLLAAGLLLFLGVHSVRIFADDWRTARIAGMGPGAWKGVYSILSLVGLALIVWGYAQARLAPTVLYSPPVWTRHLAALLMVPAFILLVAGNMPVTRIKAAVKHPMVLSVKIWAFAHLLANGTLADVVLFGAFLVWAVLDYRSARQRDRALGTLYTPGPVSRDIVAVVVGLAVWVAFAFWLHGWLFGVRPFA